MTFDDVAKLARGLPSRVEALFLQFEHSPRVIDSRWAVLGSDEGTELRVDCDNGQVWSVDPTGQLPARFVNTSILELARSIEAYRGYQDATLRVRDNEAGVFAANTLRSAILRIDRRAINEPEAWWALVVEQANDGLL